MTSGLNIEATCGLLVECPPPLSPSGCILWLMAVTQQPLECLSQPTLSVLSLMPVHLPAADTDSRR